MVSRYISPVETIRSSMTFLGTDLTFRGWPITVEYLTLWLNPLSFILRNLIACAGEMSMSSTDLTFVNSETSINSMASLATSWTFSS